MKKFTKYASMLVLLAFIFTGCQKAVEPPLYSWGNYVNSSTKYGMLGHNKEVQEKHLLLLETMINTAETKKNRVAPGIYAEYAQILFETNKKEKAKGYFVLEKQTYPEATVFIDRVIHKLYGENL